jgi:penicillin-binding protein 2
VKSRNFFLNFLLVMVFSLLGLRLFQLQIFQGSQYRQLAEGNRIRKIKIVGSRGIIFDRHGEILAKNLVVFKIKKGTQEKIIDRDEALELQAKGNDQNLFFDFFRGYPQGETFAHAVGYLGEANEEEVRSKKLEAKSYEIGDWVGRTGTEEYYDGELRGQDGGELVEVDTWGEILRRIGRVEPTPGKNLTLAIDGDLQRVAAQQMKGKRGAVVATNPKNGEVLILYSSPSFDPNYFINERFEEAIKNLISDQENRPLLDRAISGIYPPGSTFKIITATAGLEEKKITRNTLINDPGVITVGGYRYANWLFTSHGRTEGEIDIVRAIKRSTDTFFYKVGELVGVEKLVWWAGKFGLNKIFGLDLGGEIAGFVPTPEWKQKVKNEPWFLGNTYHLSIGQGDLALTPLGVNLMTSVIANEGRLCRPRMLKVGPSERIDSCKEVGVQKETINIIKEGMVGACSEGGTAASFVNFKPQVACKTGTAEYLENGRTKTHAWFTVFAPAFAEASAGRPAEEPEIALTVLVEGGGEGSSVAAPIAKEILKEYFKVK